MIEPVSIKKYHKLYIQTAAQKVSELFFKYPEKEFSLSDIAHEAGVSKANLAQIIDNFAKSGLIQIQKLTKIWRIRANQSNWFFLRNKIVYNLSMIYNSGLVERLYEIYKHPKSIVLFGSFRKGEDISTSDIDIAVESDEFKEYRTTGLRELAEVENLLDGKRIQVHEFNRRVTDKGLFNNIANGIVLYGFLEVGM